MYTEGEIGWKLEKSPLKKNNELEATVFIIHHIFQTFFKKKFSFWVEYNF